MCVRDVRADAGLPHGHGASGPASAAAQHASTADLLPGKTKQTNYNHPYSPSSCAHNLCPNDLTPSPLQPLLFPTLSDLPSWAQSGFWSAHPHPQASWEYSLLWFGLFVWGLSPLGHLGLGVGEGTVGKGDVRRFSM